MAVQQVRFNNDTLLKPKKVCAYARVSFDKAELVHSLNSQVSHYYDFINSHFNWQFVEVFHDKPITGTKEERPEFLRMIGECRKGNIDMIITKSVSRFARNTVTTLKYVRELRNLGVDVFFEDHNLHSLTQEGELMLTMYAAFAQAESLSVSENCKWRIQKKFQEGIMTPTLILGYDFKDSSLVINETEAEYVRMIYNMYLGGYGLVKISNTLRKKGIKTKYGNDFIECAVKKILTNEKYTGDVMLQKWYSSDHLTKKKTKNCGERDRYFISSHHEPIISKETFEKVQHEMQKRAKAYSPKRQGNKYLFTGLIVCGECGSRYRRKLNAAGTKYEKPVWICNDKNTKGASYCSSKQIPENILIDKTLKVLNLSSLDEALIKSKIIKITAMNNDTILYEFSDGNSKEVKWINNSRKESWTPTMKKLQGEKRKRRQENG